MMGRGLDGIANKASVTAGVCAGVVIVAEE